MAFILSLQILEKSLRLLKIEKFPFPKLILNISNLEVIYKIKNSQQNLDYIEFEE